MTEVFPIQNNPKNLDLSKTDLDFWGLFYKTGLDFWRLFWKRKAFLTKKSKPSGQGIMPETQ